jgi:hypothetical protein
MSSQKIVGGEGFNEGGATVFTTVTGEATDATNPALNREELPRDYYMYGIVENVAISAAAETQELRAAIAGRQFEVLSYAFICDAASTVTFKSGTTNISGAMSIAANRGVSSDGGGESLFTTAVGEALNITNSAGNVGGHITYRII